MEHKSVKLNKTEKAKEQYSTILGSRMSLECVVSMVQGEELTANGLNKPKQKVWYVRQATLETAIERGCRKPLS